MSEKKILILNGSVICGDGRVLPRGWILIDGGKISKMGSLKPPSPEENTIVLDAQGRYVMPGFINAHTHLYSQLARGISVGRMKGFGQVLKGLWWKLDRALTLEDIHVSAMLGAVEAIKSGVTTIVDHHASYGAITGSLGAVSEAVSNLGVRASICFEISDRCGKGARDEAVAETGLYLESLKNHQASDPRFLLRGMVGLHASMTISDETLDDAFELMEIFDVGAHVHVAEGIEDVNATRKMCGLSPAGRLAKKGILNPRSLAIHCVHVDEEDIKLIKKSGCYVVHNPSSNLNNAVGVAPFLSLCRGGVPVAIGTDGMSSGVAGDIKLASVLHKPGALDAQAAWEEVEGAVRFVAPHMVSGMFGCRVGVLEKEAAADIIIVDDVPPTPLDGENSWGHIIFGALNARVRTTIIDGKIRMHDFQMADIDEISLSDAAKKLSKRLWKRIA